jgi:hypothetical protein
MRKLALFLGLGLIVAAGAVEHPTAPQEFFVTSAIAQAADPPAGEPKDTDVEVKFTREETTTWYANPVVLAIAALIIVVLIAVAVSGSRRSSSGPNTTIVERR